MDDKFHSHLKVITAGNAAVGLFARAGCWCSDHNSDGVIPFPVAALFGKPKEIEALLAVGLWAKTDTGYVMPDFLEFNPSAEEVAERRAKRAEAGAQGGTKSGAVRRSKAEANTKQMLHDPFPNASHADEANTNPDPTRPDPTPRIPISRQTDSLDTPAVVVCRALELYADAQTPGPHVVDVAKWRRGVIRNAREEHAAIISAHPDATDIELAGLMLGTKPKPATWFPNPDCATCSDGWHNLALEGQPSALVPCPIRLVEERLATVTEIRAVG